MKDEEWLKSNDGTQISLTQIDSLGPESASPKAHMHSDAQRIGRTYVASREE